jgi:uncharacterized iron-regulated membrane protein
MASAIGARGGSSFRKLLTNLHIWVGLLSSVFFFLVAVSGTMLVFIGQLTHAQVGNIGQPRNPVEWASPNSLMQASERISNFEPVQLYYPDTILKIPSAMIFGERTTSTGTEGWLVFLDPSTGKLFTAIRLDDVWSHTLVDFHHNLLMGDFGDLLIAIIGIALIFSALSAVIMWWPKQGLRRKLFRFRFKGKPVAKFFGYHGLFGIYSAAAIAVLAFSGTYTSKPSWFTWALPGDLEAAPISTDRMRAPVQCAAGGNLEQVIAATFQQSPGRTPSIYRPVGVDSPGFVRFKQSSDLDQLYGDAALWFDCKGIIHAADLGEGSGSERAALMQYSLHSGRALGAFGQALVFVAGIALAFLSLTGFYVWYGRRSNRNKSASTRMMRHKESVAL